VIVLRLSTVAVVVASLPVIVGAEMARDVTRNTQRGQRLRDSMESAALRAAPAVRWTLAMMLSAIGWWLGLIMFADGFISIFGRRQRHNPVLMLMLPGSVLVAVGFVAGSIALVRACLATAKLHSAISASD